MDTIFVQAAQLGGTVFVTVAFLWYLTKRDAEAAILSKTQADSNLILARALQKLSDIVSRNTVAVGTAVTTRKKNTKAIDDNTTVVDKNTEEIKNGNGK